MEGELKESLIHYMKISGFQEVGNLVWQRKDEVSNLIVSVDDSGSTPHIEVSHGDADKDTVYCRYSLKPLSIIDTVAGPISFLEKRIQDARLSQAFDLRIAHNSDPRQAKPL